MTEKLKTQKDNLARLLATEDLTIVHRKVPTAYFDLKNRLLCCPILKEDISSELYDLFMGHEVSHALHTPLLSNDILGLELGVTHFLQTCII